MRRAKVIRTKEKEKLIRIKDMEEVISDQLKGIDEVISGSRIWTI